MSRRGWADNWLWTPRWLESWRIRQNPELHARLKARQRAAQQRLRERTYHGKRRSMIRAIYMHEIHRWWVPLRAYVA